jgi:methionyl-tRNA formyltransferase
MGTPDFAVPSLRAIVNAGYHVPAVVTVPDKPAGRGQKLKASAVKTEALTLGIKILQPASPGDENFLDEIRNISPELIVVVAFRKLPDSLISIPKHGAVNLHASLLPDFRGAAPIHHAVMSGEKKTGLTTFFLDSNIDTGNIILQQEMDIGETETTGELYQRMMHAGPELVLTTLRMISSGEPIRLTDQLSLINAGRQSRPAPKIRRDDCLTDFQTDVFRTYHFIRGLSPHPGAFSYLKHSDGRSMFLKILDARPEAAEPEIKPGQLFTDGKRYIKVATINGFINILRLQAEGKKAMSAEEFLRGFTLNNSWWMGKSAG